MFYEHLQVHIRGLVPTIMHNGQLADPLNKWSRMIKEISGKRNKTDADHTEIARLEFHGGLYVDEKGHPCWPGQNIEKMLNSAARTRKEGKICTEAVICDGNFPLIYDGPKTVEKLWAHGGFQFRVPVGVGQARVMRTRPLFPQWGLKFRLSFLPDVSNRHTVEEWIEIGGRRIGLSEWAPKYGRFEVVSIESEAESAAA